MINPSILILTKNDEYYLPFCLKQIEDIFDSFVLYNVGSTDNTANIIDWFVERNKSKAQIVLRHLPDTPPEVQGTFRNSMPIEGKRDCYLILDTDELYRPEDLIKISKAAKELDCLHRQINKQIRFGVFKRIELSPDLTKQYNIQRTHHRLYTQDCYWKGPHPGEESGYEQNKKSEIHYDDITVFHFHNCLRSPKEEEVPKRIKRKSQKTYHPGSLIPINLLKELPILQNRIENFAVSPALEKLWNQFK